VPAGADAGSDAADPGSGVPEPRSRRPTAIDLTDLPADRGTRAMIDIVLWLP